MVFSSARINFDDKWCYICVCVDGSSEACFSRERMKRRKPMTPITTSKIKKVKSKLRVT